MAGREISTMFGFMGKQQHMRLDREVLLALLDLPNRRPTAVKKPSPVFFSRRRIRVTLSKQISIVLLAPVTPDKVAFVLLYR
jgi:hypothetical protein